VADGALLIKLWFHTSRKEYKARLKQLGKKERKAWQLREEDLIILEHYDEIFDFAEETLEETSTGQAPWHVIESADRNYSSLRAADIILDGIMSRLATARAGHSVTATVPATVAAPANTPAATTASDAHTRSVLDTVDLSAGYEDGGYGKALAEAQSELRELSMAAHEQNISSVLAFEGWDAAGKGGTIRRLCAALDIRDYRVTSIAAPTEEERAHHYLWRFWQHLPDPGSVAIFDRTWYGRVLVERVEGFAAEHEWRRAYSEIRDFEEQLVEKGIVVCKFWLHISPDEQLRRFKAREQTDYKRYKITDEDYRNREKWPEYEAAIDEMVARTSVKAAPWTLVAANDKRHARVEVIRTYVRALKARLGDSKSKSKRDKKGR
jgi:polyphosphate:AMP phosphotransferase